MCELEPHILKNDLILEAFCKLDQFQTSDKTVYNSQPNKFTKCFYKIDLTTIRKFKETDRLNKADA